VKCNPTPLAWKFPRHRKTAHTLIRPLVPQPLRIVNLLCLGRVPSMSAVPDGEQGLLGTSTPRPPASTTE
jgi:hypothetical protein